MAMESRSLAGMDYQLGIGFVSLLITAYGVYLQRKQGQMAKSTIKKKAPASLPVWWRSPTVLILAVLTILNWTPYLLSKIPQIPNYGKDETAVASWGGSGGDRFHITANGDHLIRYQSKYKMIAVMFFNDGFRDRIDLDIIQKSAVYNIEPGQIDMGMRFDKTPFLGRRGLFSFALLLLPEGLPPNTFSTIRIAQALGAKYVWNGSVSTPQ
jgi:hypothetical protein